MKECWKLAQCSLQGKRENNEDILHMQKLETSNASCIVLIACDGMGGLPNGHEAAEVCCDAVIDLVSELFNHYGKKLFFRRSAKILDQALSNLASAPRLDGGGAAFAMLAISFGKFYDGYRYLAAWGGDCRVWLLKQNGVLENLSKDDHDESKHLTVWFNAATGSFSGKPHTLYGVCSRAPLAFGLTTDGFHNSCDPEELEAFLAYNLLARNVDFCKLSSEFIERNLSDNASAIFELRTRNLPRDILRKKLEEVES